MIAKANSTPSTPTNGVLTRLWTFVPTITSDDLKSATLYSITRTSRYSRPHTAWPMILTDLPLRDSTGDTGATFALKGMGKFQTRVTAPVFPAAIQGDLPMPGPCNAGLIRPARSARRK